MRKIDVNGIQVRILTEEGFEMVCITDIAKSAKGEPKDVIRSYFRNRANVNFLGLWEKMHNPNFKVGNFAHFKNKVGDNDFYLNTKMWIEETNAIGIKAKPGRYGGTFAHEEIAVHFSNWFNEEFYLYFIKALKALTIQNRKDLTWHLTRITNNIDDVRNLLDTIPYQEEKLKRIKLKNKDS